jgi:hypothetical protein
VRHQMLLDTLLEPAGQLPDRQQEWRPGPARQAVGRLNLSAGTRTRVLLKPACPSRGWKDYNLAGQRQSAEEIVASHDAHSVRSPHKTTR